MMLKLKLQYFGHLMRRVDSLEKTDAGRDWEQEEKGTREDEMAGCHHRLNGREFEWTPGVGNGHGGLACCNSWGHKELDTTERLKWTELNWNISIIAMNINAVILRVKTQVKQRQGKGENSKYMLRMRRAYNTRTLQSWSIRTDKDITDKL